MNKIILLGRLTDTPQIQYSAQGTAYVRFSIAVNRDRGNAADFFNCTAFDKTAEAIANYCEKGRQVLLEGRVEVQTNNNEQGKKTYFTVIVNQIEFLAKPNQSGPPPPQGHPQQQRNNYPNARDQRDPYEPYKQQEFQPTSSGWGHPN